MIVGQNYYTRFGELDLIAKKRDKLFFIEVKFRSSFSEFEYFPITNIKIGRIIKSATIWLARNSYNENQIGGFWGALVSFRSNKIHVEWIELTTDF